ncbi:MAG: GtrA family protein [Schwartzia sp.]|nr:GtrA family protein [Schwartzia sp. (in: firmicutes)]
MALPDQLKHHFLTREFLIFLVIGCVNTFNSTLLAWLYAFIVIDRNLAFNFGYITSCAVAYWLNSTFVFPEPLSFRRLVRFFISYIPNYIIQNIIVLIFYNLLGFHPIVSYLIAAVLGVPVTFLCVKLFAFGRK